MNRFKYIFSLVTACLLTFLASCHDDLLYTPFDKEGEGSVSFRMKFSPIRPALEETRASGTAIKTIDKNKITVVVYDKSGNLFKIYRSSDGQLADVDIKSTNNNLPPDRPQETTTETGTDVATFKLNNIPYGRYYFYVVANYDIPETVDISTPDKLKEIEVDWNENSIASNNAMFGYFRSDDSEATLGFNAPLVEISKTGTNLFAWVRRLASKVTVAFDPSGLNESVFIYVKSVTIHDIPKTCYLGKDNKAEDGNVFKTGETVYYCKEEDRNDHTKWLRLNKSSGVKGSKDHKDTDDALFFFENMQGDYEGQKAYYKPQIQGETGKSINDPVKDENGNITNDYKDRIEDGTYIEVEAYYVSQNEDKLTHGPIKYRFMLGQNTTYNYNAIRNHHYKLTLKFKGWANEPDWHIVYEEPTPTIFLPEQYYISYLYNQEMKLPVRIIGPQGDELTKYYLHSEITENNWIPYDPDTKSAPEDEIGGYHNINGFAWYEKAYKDYYVEDGKPVPYFGFLSVRQGHETIVGNTMTYTSASNEFLKKYYLGEKAEYGSGENDYIQVHPRWWADYYFDNQGDNYVSGNSDDGVYNVKTLEDGSTNVQVPLYTRAKELVSASDFTGNNIFDAYQRKAVVRFTLRDKNTHEPISFKIRNDQNEEVEVSYSDIPIYQVRRIVNPKGIWRRHDSTESFHVRLMHIDDAEASGFSTFESEGKWRVSILTDPQGLIKLTGNGKTVTTTGQYIEGSTGTAIDFTYTPQSTIGANATRGGVIKVEYHDYSCVHLIYVRQGYDAPVTLGGTKWSCYNAYAASGTTDMKTTPQDLETTNVIVTTSPLSIGSYFKRCQYNYAILEKNDENYGWLKSVSGVSLQTATVNSSKQLTTNNREWSAFWGWAWTNDGTESRKDRHWAGTWTATNKNYNGSAALLAVPTLNDYRELRDDPNCEFGYGVVYADGASETLENVGEAYGYTNYENNSGTECESPFGMRGCIVYNKTNGDQVFFPLGAIGQGRRSRSAPGASTGAPSPMPVTSAGTLTYGNLRSVLMGGNNVYRPLTYNLYRSPGAVYWFYAPGEKDYAPNNESRDIVAWDINYSTLVFNPYSAASLAHKQNGSVNSTNSSDAYPIKLKYKN